MALGLAWMTLEVTGSLLGSSGVLLALLRCQQMSPQDAVSTFDPE
jgi:NAD/NADP transhydrogenase beta subunit